tara:strand:+ start:486 stop:755 length:270 start_codon:yes stop_codon:yes gene_type:complete
MTPAEHDDLIDHLADIDKDTLLDLVKRFRKAGKKCKLSPMQAMFAAILGCSVVNVRQVGVEKMKEDLTTLIGVVLEICENEIEDDLSRN